MLLRYLWLRLTGHRHVSDPPLDRGGYCEIIGPPNPLDPNRRHHS